MISVTWKVAARAAGAALAGAMVGALVLPAMAVSGYSSARTDTATAGARAKAP